jgi:hypothetical protein
VGPFGLSDGAFDNYMIYFSVVISTLSFGVEISIGTFSNCEDCAVGGEGFRLLWGFLDLWWRWWLRVGFCLDLGLVLFGIGYVICGTAVGYVICGVCEGCGWLVLA